MLPLEIFPRVVCFLFLSLTGGLKELPTYGDNGNFQSRYEAMRSPTSTRARADLRSSKFTAGAWVWHCGKVTGSIQADTGGEYALPGTQRKKGKIFLAMTLPLA